MPPRNMELERKAWLYLMLLEYFSDNWKRALALLLEHDYQALKESE